MLQFSGQDLAPTAKEYIQSVLDLELREDFSTIDYAAVSEWTPLTPEQGFSGSGHRGLYRAILNGQNVFIKMSNRNTMNETKHAVIMSQFKIGPRFYGTLVRPDGEIGLVFEYLEGIHLNPYSALPGGFHFSSNLPQRIQEIGRTLANLGYKHTRDLQFRITPAGGVYVVDTEFFSYEVPRQFLSLPDEQRPLESPEKSSQILAHRINRQILQNPTEGPP